MVTIGICDDEKNQRRLLRQYVTRAVELSGIRARIEEYPDAGSLLRTYQAGSGAPEILFLDIELGSENGVEVATGIRKYSQEAQIIFVTGYADYVFRGYDVGALNYILKPCTEDKIRRVLQEAMKRFEKQKELTLAVQTGNALRRLSYREILYFVSNLRRVTAVLAREEVVFYGKLDELERRAPSFFVRTHQSYLVNLGLTERVEPGRLIVEGKEVPISRKRQQDVAGAFARFLID